MNTKIMSINIGENYLIKALENYSMNLEEACENLNYAISYDDENALVWILRGRIMWNHLKNYTEAEESYLRALAIDPNNEEAIIDLCWLYIDKDRLQEAMRLLDFAIQIQGADKAVLNRLKAVVHEHEGNLTLALELLDQAYDYTYNVSYTEFLDTEVKRLETKKERIEKRK